MDSWESTFQSWGGKVLDGAINKTVTQPYEISRLKLEALGETGYYTEGKAGAVAKTGTIAGLPTSTVMLLGGAVLLFVLLKD